MKTLTAITGIIFSLSIGLIFHAYQKEWIIFIPPYQTKPTETILQTDDISFSQKKIIVFFWKHEQWHKEETLIMWSSDVALNIKTLINTWIMLLEDEKIIDTDIQLLSAVITVHKELFLSFNKNLCYEQCATYEKLMIIESLLKTIRENNLFIQSVRFLVHHQVMIDDHLNFLISWPINGYLTNT